MRVERDAWLVFRSLNFFLSSTITPMNFSTLALSKNSPWSYDIIILQFYFILFFLSTIYRSTFTFVLCLLFSYILVSILYVRLMAELRYLSGHGSFYSTHLVNDSPISLTSSTIYITFIDYQPCLDHNYFILCIMFMYFILYYYCNNWSLLNNRPILLGQPRFSYAIFLATVHFISLVLSMIRLYHLPHQRSITFIDYTSHT